MSYSERNVEPRRNARQSRFSSEQPDAAIANRHKMHRNRDHPHWVIESTQDGTVWQGIKSSEQSYASWNQAFDYGNIALTTMIDEDERGGPCVPGEGASGAAQVG